MAAAAHAEALAREHVRGQQTVTARAAQNAGRLGHLSRDMGSTLLAAHRHLHGTRRRRGRRRRGYGLCRDRVRYAPPPPGPKCRLPTPPRGLPLRRPGPRPVELTVLLHPPLPRAGRTTCPDRGAPSAQQDHPTTSHAPAVPPVHVAAAPSRSGWTRVPGHDTLPTGRRVASRPPRRLGCILTRAFTFSDAPALRRHRREGIDEVEGSNRGDFVRFPRPLAGADTWRQCIGCTGKRRR
jgi:hypothetical protein